MKVFVEGQKVRVLTVDEMLERGYANKYGQIDCGEDVFLIDMMSDYSNSIHIITQKDVERGLGGMFMIDGFYFTPEMCDLIEERNRGFEVVSDEFRKYPEVNIQLPTRGSKVSAGYDFYLPCDITLQPGEKTCVWSDIKAYMQEGEVLMIHVRSSIGIKKGLMLSNITGVIDADYYSNESNDGNIGIALYNYSDKTVELKQGERICQGVFTPFLVADNGNTDKERVGGIGSTGSK